MSAGSKWSIVPRTRGGGINQEHDLALRNANYRCEAQEPIGTRCASEAACVVIYSNCGDVPRRAALCTEHRRKCMGLTGTERKRAREQVEALQLSLLEKAG